MTSDDDVERVIFGYLERHPFGADSLEKITEYWLEHRRMRYGVEIVGDAIARLVNGGSIERFEHAGTTLFRVASRNARRHHAD
jgi:hypothetical protein